ncbi:transmembrane protein 254 isoform X1 [Mobula birostris]|uniref:transmembrane protein 254 isoform X1 n=1 Tax=Mobula birostris TaxID=1983395 RepID=UPI003B27C7BF
MPAEVSGAYFKRVSLFWMAVITGAFGYFTLQVFWPESIPYKELGTLGNFFKYLVDQYHPHLCVGYWVAWLVHFAEALYSIKLCSDKGITSLRARVKWAFQTCLFGTASLQQLCSYKPEQKEK